jgi:hypothetical protein
MLNHSKNQQTSQRMAAKLRLGGHSAHSESASVHFKPNPANRIAQKIISNYGHIMSQINDASPEEGENLQDDSKFFAKNSQSKCLNPNRNSVNQGLFKSEALMRKEAHIKKPKE